MKQDINIIPVVQGEQAFKVNESELPDVGLFFGSVEVIQLNRHDKEPPVMIVRARPTRSLVSVSCGETANSVPTGTLFTPKYCKPGKKAAQGCRKLL